MWIWLLVGIVLVGIVWWWWTRGSHLVSPGEGQETVRWLYQTVNHICFECQLEPSYRLQTAAQLTQSDQEGSETRIHLTLWDDENQQAVDRATLLLTVLRELARSFPQSEEVEVVLLNKAMELDYYRPAIV